MVQMKKVIAIAAIVAVLSLSACSPKPSIVGKWTGEITLNTIPVPNATIEFKADKSFKIDATQQGVGLAVTGTYTATETELTSTLGDVKFVGELPPQLLQFKSQMDAQLAKLKGQETKLQYKLKDGDTAEVTNDGKTVTWSRVKVSK